jgi:Rieske 2Fe-2S family protein
MKIMATRSVDGAFTLPQVYYTSDAVFAREMQRIFTDRWLFAGHVHQIPEAGDFFLFQIAQENLIIVRDRQGQTRAFFNVCRHRGARVCTEEKGRFASGIQCPYHAWTYGLDGALVGAPIMGEVATFSKEDYPLKSAAVQVWEGLIFVNLASEPEPFEQAFGPLFGKFSRWQIADLQSVHRTVYEVDANWKLLFQNYSECYHCPGVHPVLNQLTPFRNSINDLEEGPFLGGPMQMSQAGGSMTMSGARCAAPLGEVAGDDLDLVYYYTIFPNIFLSLHPDYVLIHRGDPIAVDRTRIVCEWFFHPDAIAKQDFDPQPAIEFWDMTNRQDWHLCSISQQGISSRAYSPGPYSDLESQLAAFDREYLRALGDDAPEMHRV